MAISIMAWIRRNLKRLLWAGVAIAATIIAGCAQLSYYWQSVDVQMQILSTRQSIASVISNPGTPPELKARLQRVLEIRDFASRELKLPDNLSYRGYSDLRRPYVVWNVFAAEEFAVEAKQWCFPFAGCVSYRGYFALANAEAYANEQRSQGLDVFVGGVPAYSTLGWFDDPVLNTFVNYPEYEIARLIFHELAHQTAYAKNDSEFNESFAVTVEIEGARRWLAAHGDDRMKADFERAQRARGQFTDLVLKYRGELAALYKSQLAPSQMRERKAAILGAMKDDYGTLKAEWGGFSGYDRFFVNANNASLASIAIYHALVPQFQAMIARHGGDMTTFYAEVKKLAQLSKEERARILGIKP